MSLRGDIEREVRDEMTARLLGTFDDPIKRVGPAARALHESMLVERRLSAAIKSGRRADG